MAVGSGHTQNWQLNWNLVSEHCWAIYKQWTGPLASPRGRRQQWEEAVVVSMAARGWLTPSDVMGAQWSFFFIAEAWKAPGHVPWKQAVWQQLACRKFTAEYSQKQYQ